MADEKKNQQPKESESGTYTRPTSQIDLERRLDEGFLPESARRDNTKDDVLNPEKVNAPYATDEHDTSAYLGVSAEYMQYANETEKPLEATEGPEFESLKLQRLGVAGVRKTEGLDTEPATEVGVGSTETLNTVSSGENFSAQLVDAPKDYQGGPPVLGLPVEQNKDNETTTSAPAPAATQVAPKSSPTGKRSTSN